MICPSAVGGVVLQQISVHAHGSAVPRTKGGTFGGKKRQPCHVTKVLVRQILQQVLRGMCAEGGVTHFCTSEHAICTLDISKENEQERIYTLAMFVVEVDASATSLR